MRLKPIYGCHILASGVVVRWGDLEPLLKRQWLRCKTWHDKTWLAWELIPKSPTAVEALLALEGEALRSRPSPVLCLREWPDAYCWELYYTRRDNGLAKGAKLRASQAGGNLRSVD